MKKQLNELEKGDLVKVNKRMNSDIVRVERVTKTMLILEGG